MSDFFQVLEAQDHAAIERNGAAGEAGASAAGDDRHVVLVAPGDGLGDLASRFRQRDRVGLAAEVSALGGVAQVRARGAGQDRAFAEERGQVALERGGCGRGHGLILVDSPQERRATLP